MKCPHCLSGIHSKKANQRLGSDTDGVWDVTYEQCPECKKYIIELELHRRGASHPARIQAYPKGVSRVPAPEDVPARFSDDYKEYAHQNTSSSDRPGLQNLSKSRDKSVGGLLPA